MKRFFTALGFLTILPIPGPQRHTSEDMAGACVFFVPVGLIIGLIAAPLAWTLFTLLPAPPAAVLVSFFLLGISGGLHMDGLVDSADGLFSARNRERMLEIMRDSRIGTMGALALFLVLTLKIAALAEMNASQAARAALLTPVAGRTAIAAMMALLPYARPAGGLGTAFYTGRAGIHCLMALVLFTLAALLLYGPGGLIPVAVSLAVVLLFARVCKLRLGGATGDTLGAGCELSEAAVLTTVLLLPGRI